jgi:hypothetical protein
MVEKNGFPWFLQNHAGKTLKSSPVGNFLVAAPELSRHLAMTRNPTFALGMNDSMSNCRNDFTSPALLVDNVSSSHHCLAV